MARFGGGLGGGAGVVGPSASSAFTPPSDNGVMAITALHSAATGLRALSTRIDVVANNLANAETTAFKRSRVNFEDLMYLQLKQPGVTNAAGDLTPAGIYVGLGTRISNTQIDLEQGSLENTARPLDVGIEGNGFFKVKILDSIGDGFGYTRNGNFFVNNQGDLVWAWATATSFSRRSRSRRGRRTSASARAGSWRCAAPARTRRSASGSSR